MSFHANDTIGYRLTRDEALSTIVLVRKDVTIMFMCQVNSIYHDLIVFTKKIRLCKGRRDMGRPLSEQLLLLLRGKSGKHINTSNSSSYFTV